MAKPLTIQQFFKQFPTDDACLEHLMVVRYGRKLHCPKCGAEGKFARLAKLPAYSCPHCGHHIHPMVGTPFERSRTSLQKWFYAMFLFTTTRNGVAAKELQRQLGVTYKTAWRMASEIRKYMGYVDGNRRLGGDTAIDPVVEIDETFIGGHDEQGKDDKLVVLGMMERGGGEVIALAVNDRRSISLIPEVLTWVKPGTKIATDEAIAYRVLKEEGYLHGAVNHSAGVYVDGEVHTNTIEAFWGCLKRGIQGTYVWVSPKHLQKYLWEFEFRHNLRTQPHLMMDLLLQAFPRP